jgi:hypothetical protein
MKDCVHFWKIVGLGGYCMKCGATRTYPDPANMTVLERKTSRQTANDEVKAATRRKP